MKNDESTLLLYYRIIFSDYIGMCTEEFYKRSKSATEAKECYDAGKSSVVEYNEAKMKYSSSLAAQAQSKYNFIFKAKILDFYTGVALTLN